MIDVSKLMGDPAFSTHYTVVRSIAKWVNGRLVKDSTQILKYYGPVQPATNKELEQLPEGDRQRGVMKFFIKPPKTFYVTNENGDETAFSDEINYKGSRYKIFAVKDWSPNGYVRAFAYSYGSVDNDGDAEANT